MIIQLNDRNDKEHLHAMAVVNRLLLEKMCSVAENCANGLIHYAVTTRNRELRRKVQIVLANLHHLKKDETDVICEAIYDEARAHVDLANNNGCAINDVNELRDSITRYRKTLQQPVQLMNNRKEVKEIINTFLKVRRPAA